MMEMSYSEILRAVIAGDSLTREQSYGAFTDLMDGAWSEAQIGGFLTALSSKGESVAEIAGAAQAMREHVRTIDTRGAEVIDTCGTGGTGLRTFNISTAAALVAAGAGAKVAKHGNRTNTRASGSADVLAALGVNINADVDRVETVERATTLSAGSVRVHTVEHVKVDNPRRGQPFATRLPREITRRIAIAIERKVCPLISLTLPHVSFNPPCIDLYIFWKPMYIIFGFVSSITKSNSFLISKTGANCIFAETQMNPYGLRSKRYILASLL